MQTVKSKYVIYIYKDKIRRGCSLDNYIKVTPASDLYKTNNGDQSVLERLKDFLINHQNFSNFLTLKSFKIVYAALLIHYHLTSFKKQFLKVHFCLHNMIDNF